MASYTGNIDGFAKSPSAALRFTFVAAAYYPSTRYSSVFVRRVPRNAGELFTKPAYSGAFRPLIPIDSGHLFRSIPAV
ncbi:MAG: hypothetical protein NTY64_13435 [Deltaproteobacteria bacterium]|nr:hypothetical protein [Deltaproteobacteria bacterium]